MYDLTIGGNFPPKIFTTNQMKIGDIGEVIDGSFVGHVLLKAFNGVVSLTNPGKTWSSTSSIPVRLYKPGQKVILEIKGEE